MTDDSKDMNLDGDESSQTDNTTVENNTLTTTTNTTEEQGKKKEKGVITDHIDEDNYYEPIDYTKEGVYKVKDFDENTTKYRWKIPNFLSMKQKEYSKEFLVAEHPWRILLFPNGNSVSSLSMYLDVADAKKLPQNWTRFARFQLTVLNHKDIKKSVSQEAEKRFNANESDWGFREFMLLKTLKDLEEGFVDKQGDIIIECVVNVCKDPFLLNPQSYDSKKETGFVGLKNQGATCYMNSLLQTWYHITALRKAVYKMPIDDNETPNSSIPLALQRVFFNLQSEKSAVDTKELTKSFGWGTIDSFLQHDVQELARVLSDNLEKKMEKTPAKGIMKKLFEGTIKNYIKCINVEFESSRMETFYDLQLNVKGCQNVDESFYKYIEDEMLTGDNKYHAEGHGMQDAKKGCIFMNFPPILTLHLKRFEYDIEKDVQYKVNDRYEFPLTLDLSKYISPESEHYKKDNHYTLFSVLVHSGNVDGGHYYAFIQPDHEEGQWYRFDDEKVQKVRERDAVEENFGGDEKKSPYFWLQTNSITKKFTNAYMLVYVKSSEIADILKPVSGEDVPAHLKQRVEREREEQQKRKQEKAEAHKFVSIKIATDKELKENEGADLINFSNIEPIKVKKSITILDLKKDLSKKLSIPVENLRIWKWETRQNKTHRPEGVVKEDHDNLVLEKIFHLSAHQADNLQIYLEITNEKPMKPVGNDQYFLFFKFYDPVKKTLKYVGSKIVNANDKVGQITPFLATLIGASEGTTFKLYEEIKPLMIEPVKESATFKESELQHGDIIVFQYASIQEGNASEYQLAPEYYRYLAFRININFCKLEDPKNVDFTLELLKTMPYKDVVGKIAQKLGVDPSFIRLTGNNPYGEHTPRHQPFKTNEVNQLKDMIVIGQTITDILYYEILDLPIEEIESKKEVNIAWYNSQVQQVKIHKLLVPPESTIANVIDELRKKVELTNKDSEIRLLEIYSHRIHRVFRHDDSVDAIGYSASSIDVRAEEILPEEKETKDDKFIQVIHFQKDGHSIRTFGCPFILKIGTSEPLQSIKQRIQQKLEIKDEEFKKYKFAPIGGFTKHDYINEDESVWALVEKLDSRQFPIALGLEHKDKNSTRRFYEKPIIIKN